MYNQLKTIMATTQTEIFKHPYKWNVRITWGTFEEMIANQIDEYFTWKDKVIIGGSFNKAMMGTSRAALVMIALQKEGEYVATQHSPWEGTYFYLKERMGINENIKKGIYPVSIDWDGKTYIQDYDMKKKECYYRLTDTWRY